MELVKGFAKIAEEKYIEGYLSNPANFNGVLFVLKEPNNGGVQSRFWFKECFENYYNESSNAKRQFTKYKKTFEKLLTYVGKDLKVENCAYANVLSFNGGSRESINYQSLSCEEKTERLDSLIETCNPRCVFVCTDMFDCIKGIRRDYGFGRAIAAPQIGVKKRLICMLTDKPYVIINPTLEFIGDEMMELLDDCMSFPNLLVRVRRYRHCILRYLDENWEKREMPMDDDMSELSLQCDIVW